MLNRKLLIASLAISSMLLLLPSCYQKKGGQNTRVQMDEENEAIEDTLIDSFDPDSIAYNDTFKLVSTQTIFKHIQSNSKKKQVYRLPQISQNDSLIDYIEHFAVSNVYTTVAKLTNDKKLFKSSIHLNVDLINKITSDTLDYPKTQSIDSIQNWTAYAISAYTSHYEWVYFEAIQWLENLYLTIDNPANYTNKKKLEDLVLLQLENGTEMMMRLSAYQEYPPIAKFSDLLTNILDCKYFTFDVNQLKDEVLSVRNELYTSAVTVTK